MSWNDDSSGFGSDNFELTINLDNFKKNSLDDIYKLEMAIETGIYNGKKELVERLKEKIQEYLEEYGLGNSNIANKIYIDDTGYGAYITVLTDYAVFVEYGTGIIGQNNPHPRAWEYDTNGHGYGGWWYPTTSHDPNPNKWVNPETGQLMAWTRGQPSRPFMYRTWLWGTRSAHNIINKHIRLEIAKITGKKGRRR